MMRNLLVLALLAFNAAQIVAAGEISEAKNHDAGNNLQVMNEKIDQRAFATIDDHLYYISPAPVSCLEAMQFCNDIGMKLINLETETKNEAVKRYLSDNGLGNNLYWTGGRRIQSSWYWSGLGTLFTYTEWDTREPDFGGDNDPFVLMKAHIGWYDEGCVYAHNFICE